MIQEAENSSMESFVRESGYGNYPDLSAVENVLIIHFKNIGDMVLSEPVVSTIRNRIPNANVDFMLSKGTDKIFRAHPDIREIIVVDKDASRLNLFQKIKDELRTRRLLKGNQYDLVIVLNPGKRGERYARLCRSAVTAGLPRNYKKSPFRFSVMPAPAGRHYIERHLDVLRRIGLFPDKGRRPKLHVDQAAKEEVVSYLEDSGVKGKYIVIHPCSRWMFKSMSPQLMGKLIERINVELEYSVIVTSGPAEIEKEYVRQISALSNAKFINLSGRLTLLQLVELLRGSDVVVSVDTAAQHIAVAVDAPTVAIFGPTDEVDWGATGERTAVIASDQFSCRPCNRDGCGGSKVSQCMGAVDIEEVVMKVKAFVR